MNHTLWFWNPLFSALILNNVFGLFNSPQNWMLNKTLFFLLIYCNKKGVKWKMYSFDTLNLSSPVAMLLFSKRSYLLVAAPGRQSMGCKPNQIRVSCSCIWVHGNAHNCTTASKMLFGILLLWVWLVSSSSFTQSFFVWVFTLCFGGTCWTTTLRSSESPRKEPIAVWISHALFIPKAPHGHSGPPRLSSPENDRSGFFMLEQTSLTEI